MDTCSDCYPNAASHCHSLLILVIAWFLLFPEIAQAEALVSQEAPPAELTREALLAGWESTYGSINSMEVEFSHKLVEKKLSDEAKSLDLSFTENSAVRLLRDGIRVRSLSSTSPEGFDDSSSIRGYSFDGNRTMKYGPGDKGLITPGLEEQGIYNALSNYLRLRKHPQAIKKTHPSWVDKFTLLSKLRDYDHGGAVFPDVKVRPVQEQVAGEWCHVLEFASTDFRVRSGIKIWMATGKGMLIMRYEKTMPGGSETMEVQEIAKAETEIGDVWYPTRASSSKNYGTHGKLVLKYQLEVHKFVPYVKPSADEFRLTFPEGTRVYDKAMGIVYTVTTNGMTNFYDMTEGREGKLLDSTEYDERRNVNKLELSKSAPLVADMPPAQDGTLPPASTGSSRKDIKTTTYRPYGSIIVAIAAISIACTVFVLWKKRMLRRKVK